MSVLLAARMLSAINDRPPKGELEVRYATSPTRLNEGVLEGTAIEYGVPSDLGSFVETIQRGAFVNLEADDILFLRDHQPDRLLARTGAGTLTLTNDVRRLRYRAEMPDTSDGRDALELARRGDYGGASVGFRVEPEGDVWTNEGGKPHRLVRRAVLDHISPVGRPAHSTSVAVG